MIFTSLKKLEAFRMHTPKWAVSPTSGDGAAQHGGRLNRPGLATLYLSLDAGTAISEYKQLSTLLPPGTLVSYLLDLEKVIDFTAGFKAKQWPAVWQDFYCDWRAIWFDKRVEPPSWVIGDEAIKAGAQGILFPSQVRPNGINLALYVSELQPPNSIAVVDPDGVLPKNQSSWD